jgi:hypothetical protein
VKRIKPENIGLHLLKSQPDVLFRLFPKRTGKQILEMIGFKQKRKRKK